jgi:hypothetical protein
MTDWFREVFATGLYSSVPPFSSAIAGARNPQGDHLSPPPMGGAPYPHARGGTPTKNLRTHGMGTPLPHPMGDTSPCFFHRPNLRFA